MDEGDLARALTAFAPVWESLSPREQTRIVRLLVERVGYDPFLIELSRLYLA